MGRTTYLAGGFIFSLLPLDGSALLLSPLTPPPRAPAPDDEVEGTSFPFLPSTSLLSEEEDDELDVTVDVDVDVCVVGLDSHRGSNREGFPIVQRCLWYG